MACRHHSPVYSSRMLRHVAKPIDALYWEATLDREGGGVGPELAVLRAGLDFRLREWASRLPLPCPCEDEGGDRRLVGSGRANWRGRNIDALPERYPVKPCSERHGGAQGREEGEMEDLEEKYQTQRQRPKHCHNLLEGNRVNTPLPAPPPQPVGI